MVQSAPASTDNRRGVLEVPMHDVTLRSGMKLRFRGLMPMQREGAQGLLAVYESNASGVFVTCSSDFTGRFEEPLLHVSVSYVDRTRIPEWELLKQVKAAFFPSDVDAMQMFPRDEDFVSGIAGWEDTNVMHIWQCPEGWGIR